MKNTTVQGVPYEVWSDPIRCGTFARNTVTGEVRALSLSGYISNDLTVRKAIAMFFGHSSFRK